MSPPAPSLLALNVTTEHSCGFSHALCIRAEDDEDDDVTGETVWLSLALQ